MGCNTHSGASSQSGHSVDADVWRKRTLNVSVCVRVSDFFSHKLMATLKLWLLVEII